MIIDREIYFGGFMAKKLVEYYDLSYAEMMAEKFGSVSSSFDQKGFVKHMKEHLGEEAFLARQDLYADALEIFLGDDPIANLDVFRAIWGEELKQETGMFTEGWWLWPISRYVARHACKMPKETYAFLKEFTKRHTGEFAIRPLLMEFNEETMHVMLKWSLDENVHVRRLSSEGLRIALPWANKTTAGIQDFDRFKEILSNLRHDRSKFVQKSVGNNLNDLFKHDPSLAAKIVEEWERGEQSDALQWIIRHGRRSIDKKK